MSSSFCQYLPSTKICKSKTVSKTVQKSVSKTPARSKNSRVPPREKIPKSTQPHSKSFITESAPERQIVASTRKNDVIAKPPDESPTISGDDYDIYRIDNHIRHLLGSRITTLLDLKKDLETLVWISTNGNDGLDRSQAKKEMAILRRRICDVECGFELALYLIRTSDLLKRYRELVTIQMKSRSFVCIANDQETRRMQEEKDTIATEYLRIAREYIGVDEIHLARSRKMTCSACGGTNFLCEEEETMYTCANSECGVVLQLLSDAPTFKDTDRVNMAARYTYSCRTHFIDAMNHFEGIQNTEIKGEIVFILRREMENHALTDTTVNKDHLYMFLSENQLSSHYEDLNLLFFKIAGVTPPSISEYRSELLDMFDQVEDTYPDIKDPDRVNSMNVNFKLYKLLQLIDYPCRKDDFYILKTPAKLGEHDEKWNELIDALIKKYPNATTTKGKKRWRHIRTI